MKIEHRSELEELVGARSKVAQEVADLQRQRDALSAETAVLQAQEADLRAQTAEAMRQLSQARDALSRVHQPYGLSVRGHHKISSSSTQSNGTVNISTYDTVPDAAGLVHAQRVEQNAPAPAKKFKWGKGKTEQQARVADGKLKSSSGASSIASNPRAQGSTDLLIRQHYFQPTSILRPVRCEHCNDKMWGLQELRCAGSYAAHALLFC